MLLGACLVKNGPKALSGLGFVETIPLWNGRLSISAVIGPFLVLRASLIYLLAAALRRAFIAFWMASARFRVVGDGGESAVILGYAPKTSSVGTK